MFTITLIATPPTADLHFLPLLTTPLVFSTIFIYWESVSIQADNKLAADAAQ